jgi:hypothetical protein
MSMSSPLAQIPPHPPIPHSRLRDTLCLLTRACTDADNFDYGLRMKDGVLRQNQKWP